MVFLEDCAKTIDAGSDDPFQLVSVPEAFLAVGAGSGFALIELSFPGENFEFAIQLRVDVNSGGGNGFQKRWRHWGHGAPHTGLQELSIDLGMA